MEQPQDRAYRSLFLPTVLILTVTSAVAQAQSRDCSIAPRGVGVSAGRVSPYLELSRGAVDAGGGGSILVRGGVQLAGRGDLPIAGPWRARVEAAAASWRVERTTYGDDFQVIGNDTVGHVDVRQIVAMIGRQGGRRPACGYVLAGGGIYSLDFRGATVRRPGVALTAGIEVPTGERGAVQADLQLHIVDTPNSYPIATSAVLAASIVVGWSWRF